VFQQLIARRKKERPPMRHVVKSGLAALAVAVFVGGAIAHAETASFNIGFAFTAGGRALPAGRYQIEINASGPVLLRGNAKDSGVILSVLTRLGPRDMKTTKELVFDKVGDKVTLSEIWLAGEDGYLLVATPEKHTHVVVGGQPEK
jgi:hypothetical protein